MSQSRIQVNVNRHPLGQQGAQVTIPSELLDKGFWKLVMLYQFCYSMLGLLTGLACEVGGMILFIGGITNNAHWTTSLFGIQITDAAPGTVLFLIGLACWQFTRFDVSISGGDPTPQPHPAPAPTPATDNHDAGTGTQA
ncbi:MAG TPA: hypothetical protein V6C72_18590 [Chroococcales cyanobacterium]